MIPILDRHILVLTESFLSLPTNPARPILFTRLLSDSLKIITKIINKLI